MEQATSDSGWRGSQEGWLEAAYDSLLESGVDSVKILPLAKRHYLDDVQQVGRHVHTYGVEAPT